MNCPQCQMPNQTDSAFCANCGAQLPAAAPASSGYMPPPGQGTPVGYGAPAGYGAPSGYGSGAPAGQYPPAGQQPPAGYPQAGGQYQPRPAGAGAPMQFDLKRLTRVDRTVAIASLIAMISIWLPWYSASADGLTVSFSGTWGHGWLWLEFVVALVLIGYLALRAASASAPRLPVAHAPLLLIGTLVQLLLIVIAFADIPYGDQGMGWDWAAFIGLIAALAAAAPLAVPAAQSYMQSRR
jgi:hypothetical protein